MREQMWSRAAQRNMPGASQWLIAWRPAGMHMTVGGSGLWLAQADTLLSNDGNNIALDDPGAYC